MEQQALVACAHARRWARAVLVTIGMSTLAVAAATPAAAQITRVSVAADGTTEGNADSGPDVAISGDGRYVAFPSKATNLVANDTNGSIDVFVKDRQTNAIERVSVASDGTERAGDSGAGGIAMSTDGVVIAFTSRAALVASDTDECAASTLAGTGPSCSDIYVHNRTTHQTVRISIANGVGNADGPSVEPALSGDGHLVAFTSHATNLVAGDTNAVEDVFVSDVNAGTTVRVSLSNAGSQVTGASSKPAIDGDGQIVAFVSSSHELVDTPETVVPCGGCPRAFVRDRTAGTTTRFPTPNTTNFLGNTATYVATEVGISADGRYLIQGFAYAPNLKLPIIASAIWDRATGQLFRGASGVGAGRIAISPNGRHVAAGGGANPFSARASIALSDRTLGLAEEVPANAAPSAGVTALGRFSTDGRFLAFVTNVTNLVPEDTNTLVDVFVYDRDADGDGMLSSWETAFHLDPAAATDATLDPDGDGLTNRQEYQASSHPNGTFRRYFAEGAHNDFFTTSLALANPGTTDAVVQLTYFGSDSGRAASVAAVPADHSRAVGGLLFLAFPENFSTLIESDRPIVADRTMTWGSGLSAGGHSETAIEAPATQWFLAEGATHGAFDLFYLLQNPGDVEAQVSIDYLRPAPAPPITKVYPVPARSRRTIWVDAEGAALDATDVSAAITANAPIIVERAMYYSGRGLPFMAGHEGAGVTAPSTRWFLAEGATGAFFDLYVLIANPGAVDANLTITYLLTDGAPVVKTYAVAARSRRTIWVEGEDARLANTAVSTIVESTNNQPVIVERSMWWPFSDWYETHLSAGATGTGTRWAVAGAQVGRAFATLKAQEDYDTFLLIANTSNQEGQATIRLLPGFDAPLQSAPVRLPANSRVNVRLLDLFPDASGQYGVVVDSGSTPIVVERATYTSTLDGIIWTRGWNALATKLQ